MIVDLVESELVLRDPQLRPHQVSQIRFWGFSIGPNQMFTYHGADLDRLLLKVTTYFKNERIEFTLSDSSEERINSLLNKITEFNDIKAAGQNFKDGKFSKSDFEGFCKLLTSQLPTRKLKEHQLKAAYHLYIVRNGANFSVPGSGKTSVVLSVYERLRLEDKANVLFIVGPPACFGPWKTEFAETLGRKPKSKVLAGGIKEIRKSEYYANNENKLELYLTTFQTLVNDQSEIISFFSQSNVNVFLVVDEAHYIKQINGNWASAMLNLAKYAKFRCVLTGTPIPKSFSDLFNLFDFLWPSSEAIDSTSKIKLLEHERLNKIEEAKTILESKVSPLFYRVRKSELGLLPATFHDPIVLKMEKYEKIIYEAIERNIRHFAMDDYLRNIDFVNRLVRGRMMRLRQAVSYIPLLSKSIENYSEEILESDSDLRFIIRDYDQLEVPSKLKYLSSKVTELQAHKQKVVVWTNFVGTIELLEKHFRNHMGLNCGSIYGKTPIEQESLSEELTREQIRDEFVDPKSGLDILIANPAACAESISLHKTCHNAIYYDLTYNCAQYLQSLDRIHRVGGSETTIANYYFLQYENSIDQDILRNLRRKADRMSKIIDQDYNIYALDMFDDEDDELEAYNRLFRKK